MMKVLCFNGNLGNQIFYCAFKDYLESKYPQQKVYKYVMRSSPSVIVEDCFQLNLPKSSFVVNAISSIIFSLEIILKKLFHIRLPKAFVCGRGDIQENAMFFSNYLQDKYYYEDLDSRWLQVRMPEKLTSEYLAYEKMIIASDAICVHVRRGDYVNPGSAYEDLASTDYYKKAISMAKQKYPEGKLFFFSDDLDFTKEHFGDGDSVFVDCNKGKNSYLDIKLMSLAKVNIMANSTFSYWGAYMEHERKLVIYPKSWFTEASGRQAPNIMLNRDNWIGI